MEVALEPFPDLSLPSLCCCRYKGHVPGVAFSFGSTYGTTTLKYFQDHRNAAMEGQGPFRRGGHFPTIFSPNPNLMRSNWGRWLSRPSYTRFNLDSDRSTELTRFYQVGRGQGRPLTPQYLVCYYRAPEPAGHPVGLTGGSRESTQDSASLISPHPGALVTLVPAPPTLGELEPLGMFPPLPLPCGLSALWTLAYLLPK